MKVIAAKPETQARKISKETGVNVIAAEDGMKIDLNKMEDPLSKYMRK